MDMEPKNPCKFLHETLLGTDTSAAQNILYDAFPTFCGYADREPTWEQLEAMVVMGLLKTYTDPGQVQEVLMFVPSEASRVKLIGVLQGFFRKVLLRIPKDQQPRVIAFLTKRVEALKVGAPKNWKVIPDRWVACFFDRTSPVPPWFKEGLVEVK